MRSVLSIFFWTLVHHNLKLIFSYFPDQLFVLIFLLWRTYNRNSSLVVCLFKCSLIRVTPLLSSCVTHHSCALNGSCDLIRVTSLIRVPQFVCPNSCDLIRVPSFVFLHSCVLIGALIISHHSCFPQNPSIGYLQPPCRCATALTRSQLRAVTKGARNQKNCRSTQPAGCLLSWFFIY